MRIAAIGDLHVRENGENIIRPLLEQLPDQVEVLVIAGDFTDNGLPAEAQVAAKCLRELHMPIVGVLGNHDHQSGQAEEVTEILSEAGVCLLDASVYEVDEVGFVGTKGFCGGFGKLLVQPFGEQALKTFIQTGIDEALRLEDAASKMTTKKRVAVLHYSPIRATLTGEALEIYPFLGTSRLAYALDRPGVDIIVHGHAHHGSPEGVTPRGIPVYNVSRFVRVRTSRQPYCLLDI